MKQLVLIYLLLRLSQRLPFLIYLTECHGRDLLDDPGHVTVFLIFIRKSLSATILLWRYFGCLLGFYLLDGFRFKPYLGDREVGVMGCASFGFIFLLECDVRVVYLIVVHIW